MDGRAERSPLYSKPQRRSSLNGPVTDGKKSLEMISPASISVTGHMIDIPNGNCECMGNVDGNNEGTTNNECTFILGVPEWRIDIPTSSIRCHRE